MFKYVEELELEMKGEVYKFRQPTALEQDSYLKLARESEGMEALMKIYFEYFEMLGLPLDVVKQLSWRGLNDLFDYTHNIKKN